ncbi:HpaII family restriction endonuclease [Neisseria zalophi]|uniref:HpaII family restriction endonuclease n=1 Tax=Neisseria zalophi TaxID=640030 RepID=A0A5J6PWT0_9NEIS|nr:HpaII family restriction endonuclease [Neisseria zalophi]QEY27025.1 HpaII family restriction endonuclease [Neisseria zalophi]
MTIQANKGEWTELYVLIKLIAEGQLSQSDINLNPDPENVYQIVKGYKEEPNCHFELCRSNSEIKIYKVTQSTKICLHQYSFEEFEEISNSIFNGIKNGRGRSFRLPQIENFIDENEFQTARAGSEKKADIKLRIYDHRLACETDLGFSIKSLLGQDSTLFNTGPGNNFIYQIKGLPEGFNIDQFNSETYDSKPRISSRLQKLLNESIITFNKIQSDQLNKNLRMLDGDLPEILSWYLYYRFLTKKSSIIELTEILENEDPLNFYNNKQSEQRLYEYKIKRFLVESAMGMTSEAVWLGEYDSFGGVIIAKNDGEIVCFHIYDFNILRNYLINNTRLEQAATGESNITPGYPDRTAKKKFYYGWLYKEDNKFFIKLNLQVRFRTPHKNQKIQRNNLF